MRRRVNTLFLAVLIAVALTACTPQSSQPAAPSVTERPNAMQATIAGETQPTLAPATLGTAEIAGISAMTDMGPFALSAPTEISYDGEIPPEGASLSKSYAAPLPPDATATFAYWDEEYETWAAVPSVLSSDRITLTASVNHFSVWTDFIAGSVSTIEQIRNDAQTAGQAASEWLNEGTSTVADALHWSLGNAFTKRVESPECTGPTPDWVNEIPVSFAPNDSVRFCAGHDEKNPELLVIKARANRGYGFPVLLAVTPTWEYNSTLENTFKSTIENVGKIDAAVGESVGNIFNSGRFVGSGDEVSFGISESAFEGYSSEFLLELPAPSIAQFLATSVSSQLTAWGVSKTDGLLAASIAVASCWSSISDVSDPGNGAGAALNCASGAKEPIAQTLGEVFLARGMDARAAGKLAGQSVRRASVALAALPALLSTLDYAAEKALPRNARALSLTLLLSTSRTCTSIYSADMLGSLRSLGLSPRPSGSGIGVQMFELPGAQSSEVEQTFKVTRSDFVCSWTAGGMHDGITTVVAERDTQALKTLQQYLIDEGFDSEDFNGGRRYFKTFTISAAESVDGTESEIGQSHYIRGATWIATKWTTDPPNGYTRDIVSRLN